MQLFCFFLCEGVSYSSFQLVVKVVLHSTFVIDCVTVSAPSLKIRAIRVTVVLEFVRLY
uniref:Secreted protein n=1 Tax=Parascaris univalens TaxID=6257 RepID=A0A915AEL4_PARUN